MMSALRLTNSVARLGWRSYFPSAERFGGRTVEDQFELACLLDRKICRLRNFEDLVHIVRR
jgi:hypothetical protein